MSKSTSLAIQDRISPKLQNSLQNYLKEARETAASHGSGQIDTNKTTLTWINEQASNTDISLESLAGLTNVYARVRDSIQDAGGNDDEQLNLLEAPHTSLMQRLNVYTKTDNIYGTHYTENQISSLAIIIQKLNINNEEIKENIARHVVSNFKNHCENTLSWTNWNLDAFVEQRQDALENSWNNVKKFVTKHVTSEDKQRNILSREKIKRGLGFQTKTHTSKSIKGATRLAVGFSSALLPMFVMCACYTDTLSAGLIAGIVAAIIITAVVISTSSVAIHGCRMKKMNTKQLSVFNEIIDGDDKLATNADNDTVTGLRVVDTQGQ